MGSGILILLLFIIQVKSQMIDRLYRDLFTIYNPETLPMTSLDSPIVVKIGLSLIQVNSVDPETGLAELDTWLDTEWNDGRLRWSSEMYSNITSLHVKSDNLWTPDIEVFSGHMTSTKSLAVVNMDGHVFHATKTTFRIWCDVTGYKHDDTVVCVIKLGSWTYSGFMLDVEKRNDNVDLSNFRQMRWNLDNVTMIKNSVYYSCCPEPYNDVSVTLVLKDGEKGGFSLKSFAKNIF